MVVGGGAEREGVGYSQTTILPPNPSLIAVWYKDELGMHRVYMGRRWLGIVLGGWMCGYAEIARVGYLNSTLIISIPVWQMMHKQPFFFFFAKLRISNNQLKIEQSV